MSLISPLVKHIPHPCRFHIKVRNYVVHAKGSHPDCIVNILKNIKDQVKVGSVLGWSLMEMVTYHGYKRGEWQSQTVVKVAITYFVILLDFGNSIQICIVIQSQVATSNIVTPSKGGQGGLGCDTHLVGNVDLVVMRSFLRPCFVVRFFTNNFTPVVGPSRLGL